MPIYYFKDQQECEASIKTGLIPLPVLQSSAYYQKDQDGSILISSKKSLNKKQKAELNARGMLSDKKPTIVPLQAIQHWAEMIQPQSLPIAQSDLSLLLFKVDTQQQLHKISYEMLRLGCDRQSFCQLKNTQGKTIFFLRVVAAPYFSVLKALDSVDGYQVFSPMGNRQERIWLTLGYQHNVFDTIDVAVNTLALIDSDGVWQYYPQAEWMRLYDMLELSVATTHNQPLAIVSPEKLQVSLRLVPNGRNEPTTLWLIRDNALQVVERLVSRMPEEALAGLSFAVTFVVDGEKKTPIIILKRRAHWHKEIFLEIDERECVSCAVWDNSDNLYIPDSAILEPPLRREKVKALLAPDVELISILVASMLEKTVDIYKIEQSAFQPLEQWIDYTIAQQQSEIHTWINACQFDFKKFESIGTEWSEYSALLKKTKTETKKVKPESTRVKNYSKELERLETNKENHLTNKKQKKEVKSLSTEVESPAEIGKAEEKLQALEQEFVSLDVSASDPARMQLWVDLANSYAKLKKIKQASQCWVRLIWNNSQDENILKWRAVERKAQGFGESSEVIESLLTIESPTLAQVRLLAVELITDIENNSHQAAIKQWLDQYDNLLDVRTQWLARLALSNSTHDVLQLVDSRDRILASLSNGLSLERDVPGFMRFCGSYEGSSLVVSQLQSELSRLLIYYGKTKRKSSMLEAPKKITDAYVYYIFAWGFARLNQQQESAELTLKARKGLKGKDSIHQSLSQQYEARIQQAREAVPKESLLDKQTLQVMNSLERFDRYKVDRLRQMTIILEPQERLDPIQSFQVSYSDSRGEEFSTLHQLGDKKKFLQAVDQILARAYDCQTTHQEKARLLDGVLDFFPRIGEAEAIPRLVRVVSELDSLEPLYRCIVLEDTLLLAGFYSRQDIIAQLIGEIDRLLKQTDGDDLSYIANALAQFVDSLRRVGLTEQGLHILEKAWERFDDQQPESIMTRIQLASGFADMQKDNYLDQVVMEAKKLLQQDNLLLELRLQICQALSQASSHMHHQNAIALLHDLSHQLPLITDTFNTNSHFCLSVISFMESLILGFANDKLVLGDLGGKWLGEDELLVRKKIYHDMQSMQ
ncbi:hypothetical protein MNBD_GAMMA12-1686 [hydrothermal vent metagenome]|uniref:FtsH ternary system domain-containing protein n=1 Tax=hydrothermal vent metagenome TaxID=652676 RepID=A0A3B0YUY7_9ZZZZ